MTKSKLFVKKRPIIKLSFSNCDIRLEIIAAVGLLLLLLNLIECWSIIPELVPRHFGFLGKPDVWGSKSTLLILPFVLIALSILLTVISHYPHTFNYLWKITNDNARVQYRLARKLILTLKAEITWFFTYLQWSTIQVALGKKEGMGTLVSLLFLLIILGTLGYYIYNASRNR